MATAKHRDLLWIAGTARMVLGLLSSGAMMMMRASLGALLSLAVLGSAGCLVRARGQASSTVYFVEDDPPPPRIVHVTPRTGYVWINGFWYHDNSQWVWADGRWETERPNQTWVNGSWVRASGKWRWNPGVWRVRATARVNEHRPENDQKNQVRDHRDNGNHLGQDKDKGNDRDHRKKDK